MDHAHFLETIINNRHQSFPKFMHGLTGYGPTFATTITPILYVSRHSNVEFEGIKQVRRISHGHDVLINPAWDLGRAEFCTAQTCHRAPRTRLPEFCKV